MKKTLMHKDIEVATFITTTTGHITNVKVIENKLFPWTGDNAVNSLKRWVLLRKTAPNRADIAPIIGFYGVNNLTTNNLCSLSDCYWIKEESEDKWEIISPYKINDFTRDGLYVSVVYPQKFSRFTNNSPNLTLPGHNPLFWHVHDGTLGLINSDAQADMNAYKLAKQNSLDIFKKRQYVIISGVIYTFIKTETSPEIEKIPLEQLYLEVEDKNFTVTENLKRCCEQHKIPNWDIYIKKLLQFNTISTTRKIELSDIGVLRDTNTLTYLGFDKI